MMKSYTSHAFIRLLKQLKPGYSTGTYSMYVCVCVCV